LKIRLQADADLRVPIIKGLKRREPTIDFATAHDAGLAALDDRAVLALAAANGRLLVSHDVSTMPKAFSHFIQEQTSPGVILISQDLSYREAIEGLLRIWLHTEAEDWANVMSFLPL
jgi:predicted nuclease of predicted toxin-antitoxin system